MRFLSHHDLMRLFERALRRSGLPLRMTEGFNPHPIISFPTALALGIESADEVMEFELDEWTAPRRIETLLSEQLPEGVGVNSAETFDRKKRSFVDYVDYEALCPGQGEGLKERIQAFLAEKEVRVDRVSDKGTKTVEVRQYVLAADCEGDRVSLRIRITDRGTARPDELLRTFGVEVNASVRFKKLHSEMALR